MPTARNIFVGLVFAATARSEEVAPQVTRAAIRQALLEHAATPRLPPRLPTFGTDPIRAVREITSLRRPGELRGGLDGVVRRDRRALSADRAAGAAANRALDGRGPRGGERRPGPGKGRSDREREQRDRGGPKPGQPPP